jgi:transcription initiation factor TFIIIB Brf1 subunit/transcription initiation factor TFIIB
MISDIHEINECPDCGSLNIIHNERREQVICRDCGLIFEPLTPKEEELFEQAHELAPRARAKPKIRQKVKKAKPSKARKKAKKKPSKKAKKKVKRKQAKRARKKKR